MIDLKSLNQDELLKMFGFNMQELGEYVLANLKTSPFFPVRTGLLRDSGTRGSLKSTSTFNIAIGVGKSKQYVEALNEGSQPHNIPNAFGYGENFGIGGRFNGKFHPGQSKHKGFVDKLFNLAIEKCKNYAQMNGWEVVK